MTDNNTTDHNKRIADLLSELFIRAADDAASQAAVGQDSIEELINTTVNEAIQSNELDAMDEDAVRSICDDAVEDAVTNRIGYSEVITGDNFNDWLEDADAMSYLAREDYVDDAVMYAVNEIEADFVTVAVVNQMLNDFQTDLEAAKLSTRIKRRVDRLFTLTRTSIKSLLSFRVTLKKVEG